MLETHSLKVPPHSIEAEQSVLGGLLLDEMAWDRVADLLRKEDFYRHDHQLIFEAIGQLVEQNRPPDIVTVGENLERQGSLEEAGGTAYLANLANITPTSANIAHYARAVRERSVLRSLIQAAGEIAEDAFQPGEHSVSEVLDQAEQRIFRIADQSQQRRGGFSLLRELLRENIERLDELFQRDDPLTGLPTGFTDLDDKTSGLQDSDLIVIAGRPSMGKTSFVLNMAEHVCVSQGVSVAVFSLEMPREQLTMRLLASRAGIDAHKMRNGNLHADDWPKLTRAVGELSEAPLYIDDTPALGPIEMRARCRRLKREQGLGLVIVDYLQLMHGTTDSENRTAEISEISRALKALSRELDVPVIALSQLNRSLEQRQDKRPMMSDLRECVSGETPVVLSDGRRVPISRLVGHTPEIMTVDQRGRLTMARAEAIWSVGRREVLEIRLAGGHTLRLTPEHWLRGSEDWAEAGRFGPGDVLALARSSHGSKRSSCHPGAQGADSGLGGKATEEALTGNIPYPPGQGNGPSALHEILDQEPSTVADPGAWADLSWERVVGVRAAGEEEVFDLTVPETACWLADGILSHNSGAIEQDADVIMFIYRDEVYHPDNPETQGVAELIIAKQRNGPTGKVRLTFLNEYTRFESYAGPEFAPEL